MPRLNHRKTKTGCSRCKARKVKCDEKRPACTACSRHSVQCEYASSSQHDPPRQTIPIPSPSATAVSTKDGHTPASHGSDTLDHNMEMRLMHNWTANAAKTLGVVWEYYLFQAPLIALEYRYAMDSLLALSARHAARQAPTQWVSLQGRMIPLKDPTYSIIGEQPDASKDSWHIEKSKLDVMNDAIFQKGFERRDTKFKAHKVRCKEMRNLARVYFDRALEGHRKALLDLTIENVESVYLTAIFIGFNTLASLGESEDNESDEPLDFMLWFRVGYGVRNICEHWDRMAGPEWMARSGVFYGKPDFLNRAEFFRREHGEVFQHLLTFGSEYEHISEEDAKAYEMTVSYIGLIHKMITSEEEEPLCTFRRFTGMPSIQHPRFFELLQQKTPRALVIMAHTFALAKMIADSVIWLRGLAEKQIPHIDSQLPPAWKQMMKWPLEILASDIGNGSKDDDTHDILSF